MKAIIVIGALLLLISPFGCDRPKGEQSKKQAELTATGLYGKKVFSGLKLSEDCAYVGNQHSTTESAAGAGFCAGYIASVSDEVDIFYQTKKPYCIPDDVDIYQLIKVVVKYLDSHPERLHEPAGYLVFQSYQEAFPCKPNGNDKVEPRKSGESIPDYLKRTGQKW